MYILEGKKLSKSYGQNKAVNSLDIGIENGEILALLGPGTSGIGKECLPDDWSVSGHSKGDTALQAG